MLALLHKEPVSKAKGLVMIFKPMPPIVLFDDTAQLSDDDKAKLTTAGYLPIYAQSVDGIRILGATTSPGPIVAAE